MRIVVTRRISAPIRTARGAPGIPPNASAIAPIPRAPNEGKPINVIAYRLIKRPRISLGAATCMKVAMIVPNTVETTPKIQSNKTPVIREELMANRAREIPERKPEKKFYRKWPKGN